MSTNASPERAPRALISVSDKTGLEALARGLHGAGYELLSTGGTARFLSDLGLPVTAVSAVTQFPEIMGGRVKTLHPKIHGGILARRDEDAEVMREQDIAAIDVVVVNLYPFQSTIAKPDCSLEQAVEQIDIGGPAMIRAAAKNHRWVTTLVDSTDYGDFLRLLPNGADAVQRRRWAAKAFGHTAQYDAAINEYLLASVADDNAIDEASALPTALPLQLKQVRALRYGENPHQRAALYQSADCPHRLAAVQPLQGKVLSYNNLLDADAAWQLVRQWPEQTACAIIKHGNPCGAAVAETVAEAYQKALSCDAQSAFGGIIASNREIDEATAQLISQQFAEVIIAPSFSAAARDCLAAKKNLRLLAVPVPESGVESELEFRCIDGGILVQDRDLVTVPKADWRVVTEQQPNAQHWHDLHFAWQVVRSVKSNAIVYAANGQTVGVGAGQMSRVDSARIAREKAAMAKLSLQGSAMASDAFFPFPDSVEEAAAAGVSAIVQPGGSMRDEAVIEAANQHGIVMVFTGRRHFRH